VLLGRRLTRWAVAPLSELSQRLEQSDPTQHAELGVAGELSKCLEVREVQLALQTLIARIDGLLGQAQRFAADAAHELRTPLSTLRLRLELLEERTTDAQAREEAHTLAVRVQELADLLDRLLLLASPIEALRQGFVPVSLEEVVVEVVSSLREIQKQRVVVTHTDEGLILGDPLLLRSLVGNAIDNALKFASNGTIEVRLQTNAHVVLQVNDQGPGIPKALEGRVFEAFFRARPDATRGHGLGLALIGHIARAHGGEARFVEVARGASLLLSFEAMQHEAQRQPALSE
jgi:signal transduction histidine kinase